MKRENGQLTLLENPGNTEDVLLVAELELGLVSLDILHHLLISSRSESHSQEMTDLLNTRLSSTDSIYALGIETCRSALSEGRNKACLAGRPPRYPSLRL